MEEAKKSASPAVDQRLALLNNAFTLSAETERAMERVRVAVAICAKEIANIVGSLPHDTGRLIAALDSLQAAKNLAEHSLLLQRVPKS